MAKYEAAMIFSLANGEEATAALKEKFNDLIAKNGTVDNVDDWGKRRLAYPINDEADGYYVFFNFRNFRQNLSVSQRLLTAFFA